MKKRVPLEVRQASMRGRQKPRPGRAPKPVPDMDPVAQAQRWFFAWTLLSQGGWEYEDIAHIINEKYGTDVTVEQVKWFWQRGCPLNVLAWSELDR